MPRFSRRKLFEAASSATVVAAAEALTGNMRKTAATVASGLRSVAELFARQAPTEEQRRATLSFHEAANGGKVIRGIKPRDPIESISLYNSPRIDSLEPDKNKVGELSGSWDPWLETGAIGVWGDSELTPQNRELTDKWLAFINPYDPEKGMIFSLAKYFSGPNGENIYGLLHETYLNKSTGQEELYEVRPEMASKP